MHSIEALRQHVRGVGRHVVEAVDAIDRLALNEAIDELAALRQKNDDLIRDKEEALSNWIFLAPGSSLYMTDLRATRHKRRTSKAPMLPGIAPND